MALSEKLTGAVSGKKKPADKTAKPNISRDPVNETITGIKALRDEVRASKDTFTSLITIMHEGISNPDLPAERRVSAFARAMADVIQKRFGRVHAKVSFRTTPHSIIVHYTVFDIIRLSPRLEVFYGGYRFNYTLLDILPRQRLIQQAITHLKNLQAQKTVLRAEIKKLYDCLLDTDT